MRKRISSYLTQAVYSRVARVCKNDKGGPHKFKNKWTTFLKSRLNCSVPGDIPFYFNEIQSTSNVAGGDRIYGVFTTPDNSIAGSAVCSFRLRDILATFEEGPFKNQDNSNANWLPMSKSQIPSPRPGLCYNDTFTLPESSLNFIKRHSLMDWAVPGATGGPVFVRTSMDERLTVIAVDSGVEAIDGRKFDVIFAGTTSGRVLKIIDRNHDTNANKPDPVLIESMQVFPYHVPVRNVLVTNKDSGGEAKKLVVLSDHEVNGLPLHRCGSPAAQSCHDCVGLQDPYCAWDLGRGLCVSHRERILRGEVDASSLLQEIDFGLHAGCPAPKTTTAFIRGNINRTKYTFCCTP